MATRLPPLTDVAASANPESSSIPSASFSSSAAAAAVTPSTVQGPSTAAPVATPGSDVVKLEDSPTPSALTSADAETPAPDNNGTPATGAGRKRKLNCTSARGVANLTPEQLAKKRANDRQAQRAIRERTKAHIDSLEQRVRDLSSQKPFLDLQAALRQNEVIQAENREIRHGLKAIMDIIQPLLGQQEKPNTLTATPSSTNNRIPPITSTPPLSDAFRFSANTQRPAPGEHPFAESATNSEASSSTAHAAFASGTARREITATGPASFRIAFDYQRHNLAHGLDFGGTDERMGFNFLLDASQQVPKVEGFRRSSETLRPSSNPSPTYPSGGHPSMAEQPLPAYLTPIRNVAPTCTLDAILLDFLHNRQHQAAKGVSKQSLVGPSYPSVSSLLNPEKSVYSHPLSKVFTDILRTFPDISTLPEQVAVLFLMFLLMRWQIYPTPENYDRLPEWLTPRPSQLLTAHPAWIDYLPWPRMRDRLVMSYQDYPFENWFIPFTRTLSVNWPYEATDCLLSSGDGDELMVNPVFERHFRNLSNWSLGPAFAEAYPSLVETTRIRASH
ncbi:bZIP transcription factor [Aspergillus vadensis CBS 113365]|uniref:BZIP transcription factor n=1 Tax=Aspergillus vadensis (strain CBS 113365 / IMI 142717 / IBT 24658) TaxID=1448311 RepID=A0A319AWS1_ASPVC|nr:bZIP transcription factor [Aspergillus vadensis CBS 113365]PYH64185.1 bZIP transcription factor [Aspergillus vadensis CBS 113365]